MANRQTKPKSLKSVTPALLISKDTKEIKEKPILRPRTPNQERLIRSIDDSDIIVAVGPAGTGKTKISVAKAVERFEAGDVKKLILMRPAVEAQEKIGFLPGDTRSKLHPYLVPLFDFLTDYYTNDQLESLMKGLSPKIEIAPLGMCRGRNFSDCIVICDEMQNATLDQIILVATRLCDNCTIIFNGDPSQTDLRPKDASGLIKFADNYGDIEGIATIFLTRNDIVRHPLVSKIVERKIERDD